MKKVLLIIMCIIISFALASCSNNTTSENKISSKNNNQIVSEQKTDTVSDTVTETSTKPSENTEKKIVKFYVNHSGFKMDVNFDEDDINEILDAEKNASVPDVKMKTSFAELIAVYDDNTEGVFGTIYMGEDDCYYLKFANSEIEGAAYKMGDSSLTENLF
ncbi:hypothetical protein [uncultured Eubacterium sp.]|uniref:hypothetical protein n=1 Tax=uncultured Eubacterium sp. TaxID=165185 RepID=UPI002805719D|nr:hypothetical protein [uncultured Eubacterium sp.]